jgi:hypothetical protein
MNDVSLIRTIREIAHAGLFTASKLLSEDLLLCDRFRERRPRAFSEEKSLSKVQSDVCESASKLAESSSKLPREEDEKKRKRVMPIIICFTSVSLYHSRANSQLQVTTDRHALHTFIRSGRLNTQTVP